MNTNNDNSQVQGGLCNSRGQSPVIVSSKNYTLLLISAYKPCPIADQNGQILYPISDQNGLKPWPLVPCIAVCTYSQGGRQKQTPYVSLSDVIKNHMIKESSILCDLHKTIYVYSQPDYFLLPAQ